jgi:hypothetical protein
MVPHGSNLNVGVNGFRGGSNHSGCGPACGAFSFATRRIVESNTRACPCGAPCQGAAKQATAYDSDVSERHE